MRLQLLSTRNIKGGRFIGDAEAAERIMELIRAENGLTLFGETDEPTVIIEPYLNDENLPAVCLRHIRKRVRKMSQDRLAALTGIDRRHISEVENGKLSIGKVWAKRLGAALDCDYRIFL